MSEKTESIKETAQQAIGSEKMREELVADLSGSSRRARQDAAAVFAQIAKVDPEILVPYIDDFIDALKRPEAQTRWESLEVLTTLVPLASKSCDKALADAETALFDEENGFVRLAALRFLCKLGATTAMRSEKWFGRCSTRLFSATTAIMNTKICSSRSLAFPRVRSLQASKRALKSVWRLMRKNPKARSSVAVSRSSTISNKAR